MTTPNKITQKHRDCAGDVFLHSSTTRQITEIIARHFPAITRGDAIERIVSQFFSGASHPEGPRGALRELLAQELAQISAAIEKLKSDYKENLDAAVALGEIDEGSARYVFEVFCNVITPPKNTTGETL